MIKKDETYDLTVLSEVFLEALKDISKSGNKLTAPIFARFLAKRPKVVDILKLANRAQKDSQKSPKKKDFPESQLEAAEEKLTQLRKEIVELEMEFNRERDYNTRIILMLLNICRVRGNETLFDLMDEYKQLVIDGAHIENRKDVLDRIKNTLVREDVILERVPEKIEAGDESGNQVKSSVIKKFFGDSTEIKLKSLKKASIKGLKELGKVLDNRFQNAIQEIENRIDACEDVDYLLAQRTQVNEILREYVRQVQEEQDRYTVFVKDIGVRLMELEQDLLVNFANSHQSLKDDYAFHEHLGDQVSNIEESVEKVANFAELKTNIIAELNRISETIDEKRQEFTVRLENAEKEKENLQKHFTDVISNVTEQNKMLLEKSQKDNLTGIYNRESFEKFVAIEIQRYHRYMQPVTIIFFDIDNLREINETYGHDAGDRVLKGMALNVGNILRMTDILARYDGEEFIVLLPHTELKEGINAAQKLRKIVQDTAFVYKGEKVRVTVSIGVSELQQGDMDFVTIFKRLESYLLRAKQGGRNMVVSDIEKVDNTES